MRKQFVFSLVYMILFFGSTHTQVATEATKNQAFSLGRICYFNTHSGRPYTNTLYPDLGMIRSVKCNKDIENLHAVGLTTRGYSSNIKEDKKYNGGRDSVIGNVLAKVFLSHQFYPHPLKIKEEGTVLVDEYKISLETEGSMVFRFLLQSIDELESLAVYLSTEFDKKDITATDIKPLLIITVDQDTALSTLSEEARTFFDAYFTIVSLTDAQVRDFVEKHMKDMCKLSNMLEGSRPLYVGENFGEAAFRTIEGACHKFEAKKIVPALVGFIITSILIATFKDWIKTQIRAFIPTPVYTPPYQR